MYPTLRIYVGSGHLIFFVRVNCVFTACNQGLCEARVLSVPGLFLGSHTLKAGSVSIFPLLEEDSKVLGEGGA